ncbi:MnhB domain-containing protein [Streptomyces sp. NPDC095613]|uniref:MnhB domain-containing protein n=1 Tax=Streptomyces sp. NPDC095613 TaxID=3155540 RepID=UPI0033340491
MFVLSAAVVAGFYAAACTGLPRFGSSAHPYGARAVAAALAHRTANVVSSVNFDLRAFDTLGEESILYAAVLGATVLLRLARDEGGQDRPRGPAPWGPASVQTSSRLFGAVLLPVALLTGCYIVAHGQLSPGGGFQGGVILATGLHLAYVAADYWVLRRVRPVAVLDVTDAVAAASFSVIGVCTLIVSGAFLANVLSLGTLRDLASGGLVPVINAVVGVEVASAVIVLVAHFLDFRDLGDVRDAGGGQDVHGNGPEVMP